MAFRVFESPSNAARLAFASEYLRGGSTGAEALVIGAGREAVDDLVRELALRSEAIFGLRRYSWNQLVTELALPRLAASGRAPASSLGLEAVAARAAFDAAEAGEIPDLVEIVRFPGFARALARTLGELRLAGIDGSAEGAWTEESRDLAWLLGRMERELEASGIADRAARLRAARAALDDPGSNWVASLPLVLLDVPLDSALERELAEALLMRARDAIATVPAGDTPTLEAFRAMGGMDIAPDADAPARGPTPGDASASPASAPPGPRSSPKGFSTNERGVDSSPADAGVLAEPEPLRRLRRHLFAESSAKGEIESEAVQFFSAPGEGRECVEIARRILMETRNGRRLDRIAIFTRAPETYASHLETAFRRAGIDGYFARGTRRPDPSGRAFLALLACKAERLSAKRFAEYLSFGQVPEHTSDGAPPTDREFWVGPDDDTFGSAASSARDASRAMQLSLFGGLEGGGAGDTSGGEPRGGEQRGDDGESGAGAEGGADGQDDGGRTARGRSAQTAEGAEDATDADGPDRPELSGTLRAPWRWEEFLVEAAVIGGRDRWKRRLQGLDKELQVKHAEVASAEPDSPRLAGITRDLANLRHLERFALPAIEFLDGLPRTAPWSEWLRMLNQLAPMVLRDPERVLGVLAELQPMGKVGPVGIEEVRVVLWERLTFLEKERPEHRFGRVYVAPPELARGRTFDIVFVPGLAERVFPQRPREDPLLLDSMRRDLSDELMVQEDRARDERLRLRLAVGAAREQLILSYSRVDVVEARPRVPSFYALDVARAVRGRLPDYRDLEREAAATANARLAWPAPEEPDDAIDSVEHDLSILFPLLNSTSRHAKGRARYLLELNPHLARSLRTRYVRWQRAWGPHDGIVRTTKVTEPILQAHRLPKRPYSVTALEKYAVCPYRFLLSAIHRLEPREDTVALVRLDPLTRGSMIHEMQAKVLRRLRDEKRLPLPPEAFEEARRVLDRVVESVARAYEDELAPAIPRVWQDEIDRIRGDLRVWLQELLSDPQWSPRWFELAFGLPEAKDTDPESRRDPVKLEGGWRIRGAIDMVEEEIEGDGLRVTDHKTGRAAAPLGTIVGAGEQLQPVLYSMAVSAALGRPVRESRLWYCTSRGGFQVTPVEINEFALLYGKQVLQAVDRAVQEGVLPPAPRVDACKYCDFRVVCGPNEETRVKKKDQKLLRELQKIRELP